MKPAKITFFEDEIFFLLFDMNQKIMASFRWLVKVPPPPINASEFENMAATPKVWPYPRCQTSELSVSQKVAQKHVSVTQKGKLLYILVIVYLTGLNY